MASRKDNYNINAVIPYVEEGQDWSALSGEAESASPPITNHTNSENDRDPPRGRILRHSQGLRPFRDTSARLPSGNSMKRMSQTIEGKTVDLAKNPSSCKENLTNGSILASGKHKRAAASRVSRAAFRPIQPKENSSSSVKMETLVRSRTGQSSVKVPALARIDIQKDDAVNFLPTCTQQTLRVDECYADFKAICRGGLSLEEAYEAESLLRSITQRYKNGLSSFRPSGKYFNYVMHAFAELGHPNAAKATLGLMLEAHEQGSLYDAPDVRVFNTLLHAWRRSKERDAPIQGELVLQHMYRLHSSYNIPCQPNLRSYTILLQCWVESNREDAADGAERIFRCMNCPDRVAYVTLLALFTKNDATHNRAENLLWEMVGDFLNGNNGAKPYIRDFNSCMAMWSKSLADEAPHRAMRLILRLLRLNETSRLRAIPDSYTYGLLLKAWAKHPNAAIETVNCLHWMKETQKVRIDEVMYTTCMVALARKGYAAQAENLLKEMCHDFLQDSSQFEPTEKMFELVIGAWTGTFCNNHSTIDTDRAQKVVSQMWLMDHGGIFRNIRPSVWTYKFLIGAMKKIGRPDRANAILDEAERYFDQGVLHHSGQPALESAYQMVIDAWESSTLSTRYSRARGLKIDMLRRFPSTETWKG